MSAAAITTRVYAISALGRYSISIGILGREMRPGTISFSPSPQMIFISMLLALLGNTFPASAYDAKGGPMQHYASSTHPMSARDSAIESSQDEYSELRNSSSLVRTARWIGLPLQMTSSLVVLLTFA